MKTALLLIDIQNDFIPGGNLAVPDGDKIIPVVNQLIEQNDLVVATKDWHPADHLSFASQHNGQNIGDMISLDGLDQILWPDHCVQGTIGAEFVDGLATEKIQHTVFKGTDRRIDSYSGFFDNAHKKATGLGDYLKSNDVKSVVIVGLATDYCVKFTALDAVELGYQTSVIREGVRGVELNSGDCEKAIAEMTAAGVSVK